MKTLILSTSVLCATFIANVAYAQSCETLCLSEQVDHQACVIGCRLASESDNGASYGIAAEFIRQSLGDAYQVNPCSSAELALLALGESAVGECANPAGDVLPFSSNKETVSDVLVLVPKGADVCDHLSRQGFSFACPDNPPTVPITENPCIAGECPQPIGRWSDGLILVPMQNGLQ